MKTALAVLALLGAAPAAGQGRDAYALGVEARHAGDNDRAIALLGEVVRSSPANADAHLQYGLALLSPPLTR